MALKATAVVDGDTVTITPAGSPAADIAKALLDAANGPGDLATVTTSTGLGWRTTKTVAEKAGLVDKPKPKTKAEPKADRRVTADN